MTPTDSVRFGVVTDGVSARMTARVLDAADRCLDRDGFDGATMTAVAELAGVSRQTMYRMFESREHLLRALGLRQTDRLLTLIVPRAERKRSAPERVVEFTKLWGRGFSPGRPEALLLRSDEVRLRLGNVVVQSSELLPLLADHLRKVLADAPDAHLLRVGHDWLGMARTVNDFGAGIRRNVGGPRSDRAVVAHLRRYLVPALFDVR